MSDYIKEAVDRFKDRNRFVPIDGKVWAVMTENGIIMRFDTESEAGIYHVCVKLGLV